MSSELGLAIRKPVSVWNKPLRVNFKDLFKALGKAGFDTATQQWIGVGKDAVDVMAAVGLDSNKPAELAWALIYNSLVSAIAALVSDSSFLVQGVPENLDQLCETLDFSLEDLEFEITASFFEHPEQLPILDAIKVPLRQWLEGFWVDPSQAEALSNSLPSYFVVALNHEWRRHAQDYGQITEQIKTPFTQASERERGWRLYRAWLNKQIHEPIMFEGFGLDDVYVPLRGYLRQKITNDAETTKEPDFQRSHDSQDKFERVVIDLETATKNWLKKSDQSDGIRVISGGPGSGKSSFAKILAARLATQGEIPVLFIPLHQFDPTGDLVAAVGDFIRYDQYFRENPLNPDDPKLRLLIIFDGLDELAMQGKIAKEVAQDFVREIQGTVSNFNRHQTRLQVLLTGRDVVVQNSFRDSKSIVQVLPYVVSDQERQHEPYLDAQQLLGEDQRNQWWKKYGKASQQDFAELPQALNRDNLTDITAQPLLNYLVALSYVQGKLQLSETTNLNTVYYDLLNAVYDRGYEGKRRHAAIADMTREEFVRVLEEIALAAWHGDGRTTTVREIEVHCESSGLRRLLERFEEGAKAGVTRLLAAFYFRQSGVRGNDRTFEFTHKSFGEYLTAKRIVRAIERIQKQLERRREDMEEGWDEREALLHWANVCGPTRIDNYLLNFLQAEVALRSEQQLGDWQKTLSHLIGVMLRQGMPMERVEPSLKYYEMSQWATHSEEALLVMLSLCARITTQLSSISWPDEKAFGSWIRRLQGQRENGNNVAALKSLTYMDSSYQCLDLIDLFGAYLQGINLLGASMVLVNLRRAVLSGAVLIRVDLSEAGLGGANLSGADLSEANLSEADLSRADLSGADLSGADLSGADLSGAVLSRADLSGAVLSGADLTDAIYFDEDLNGARI